MTVTVCHYLTPWERVWAGSSVFGYRNIISFYFFLFFGFHDLGRWFKTSDSNSCLEMIWDNIIDTTATFIAPFSPVDLSQSFSVKWSFGLWTVHCSILHREKFYTWMSKTIKGTHNHPIPIQPPLAAANNLLKSPVPLCRSAFSENDIILTERGMPQPWS